MSRLPVSKLCEIYKTRSDLKFARNEGNEEVSEFSYRYNCMRFVSLARKLGNDEGIKAFKPKFKDVNAPNPPMQEGIVPLNALLENPK